MKATTFTTTVLLAAIAVANVAPVASALQDHLIYYPARDKSFDHLRAPVQPLSRSQVDSIVGGHYRMPQSYDALVSVLGAPIAHKGKYSYWPIQGRDSELAIWFDGYTAFDFTIGR